MKAQALRAPPRERRRQPVRQLEFRAQAVPERHAPQQVEQQAARGIHVRGRRQPQRPVVAPAYLRRGVARRAEDPAVGHGLRQPVPGQPPGAAEVEELAHTYVPGLRVGAHEEDVAVLDVAVDAARAVDVPQGLEQLLHYAQAQFGARRAAPAQGPARLHGLGALGQQLAQEPAPMARALGLFHDGKALARQFPAPASRQEAQRPEEFPGGYEPAAAASKLLAQGVFPLQGPALPVQQRPGRGVVPVGGCKIPAPADELGLLRQGITFLYHEQPAAALLRGRIDQRTAAAPHGARPYGIALAVFADEDAAGGQGYPSVSHGRPPPAVRRAGCSPLSAAA